MGFFIYTFNLSNGLFWDDNEWIVNNRFVHSLSNFKNWFTEDILSGYGLRSNYYRPFLLFTFALNYLIGVTEPLFYHLANNGFHIANGVLIFYIFSLFFKNKLVPFLASILFLIHPVQVEAVAYISGRGDPMSVFFMLLALLFFLKAEQRISFKITSLLFFILAILSRESAVIFPLLLMIFYISFLTKDKFISSLKQSFVKIVPYFVIAGIYVGLRLTILNFKNTLNFFSQSNIYTENLIFRLYTFLHALAVYFKLIFVPLGLHMERDLPLATSIFTWPVWLSLLIIIGLLYLIIRDFNKTRIWFFAWAWFFVSLGPVSGIIPLNAFMYEHWLYLPLIGFFTLAAFYIDKLYYFLSGSGLRSGAKLFKGAFVIALVAYLSFFAVASVKRNIAWGNPIAFYEDTLRYSPESIRINNNLGNLYHQKDIEKAKYHYQKAIELKGNFAQPHYNLANILRDEGKIDEAIEGYKKAIEIDPNFPFAYQNLVVIYADRGELVEATGYIEELKKLRPDNAEIFYNSALLYIARNDFEQAERDLKFVYEIGDEKLKKLAEELLNLLVK